MLRTSHSDRTDLFILFNSNEDSSDSDSGKLLDCIKCLEGLADDGVYWPEKEMKIKETIAGLKKDTKQGCVC